MKIQHNLPAMNANRIIKVNTGRSSKTSEKLSSGYQINRAADDAAGLSISEKMRRLIRGLTQASQNCQDGISMVQTAEGALHEVHDMLQRMNELAVQSANGTNAEADRQALQQEFAQIQDEIDRVSQTTTFNAMRLFADGDGATNTSGTNSTNNTNNTNNANTPAPDPATPAVMSLRSTGNTTSVTVGNFTLTGDGLVEGEDYKYEKDRSRLTILSDRAITITGNGNVSTDRIIIGSGVKANVTLNNVSIDASGLSLSAFQVNGGSSVNLTLTGVNKLTGGSGNTGLQVNQGATLVITEGSGGSLEAVGGDGGAGIGGSNGFGAGNITINGGTVKAIGGRNAAGIGCGHNSVGGNITGGNITINGGTVEATGGDINGGYGGAGIGGGYQGGGGNITITGGKVTATGGGSSSNGGAGIGSGSNSRSNSGGTITITGGTVTATGGSDAAAIGGGVSGSAGDIIINGGTVYATGGGSNAAAIGKGLWGSSGTFSTGTNGTEGNAIQYLSRNGDTSAALTDLISDTSGKDNNTWDCYISINGGELTPYGDVPPLGSSTIDLSNLAGDLTFTDTGYKIGNQEYRSSGPYTLSGSTDKNITVSSNASITLNNVSSTGTLSVAGGAEANVTLSGSNSVKNVSVATGGKLNLLGSGTLTTTGTVNNSGTMDVASGTTLTNTGTFNNNSGATLNNDGTTTNNGTFTNNGTITGNNIGGTPPTGSGTGGGTTTGGTGGGSSSGGTGGGTGGGSGTGGTGGATTDEAKNSWWIQAGAEAGQGINIEIGAMDTNVLGIEKTTVNILTQESSGNAITAVSGAIEKLSAQRSRLGAYQNRLEHTIRNLDNVVENTTAAESRIRDADMAELMVEHSNNNIIQQVAQAMLAQANQQPQSVVQLLQ